MTPCRHPSCAICLPLCAERSIRASALSAEAKRLALAAFGIEEPMDDPDVFRRCRNCRLTAGECDCRAGCYGDEEAQEEADRRHEEQAEIRAINDRGVFRD